MGQSLAEQNVFGDSYEDLSLPPMETAVEKRNEPLEGEDTIKTTSLDNTRHRMMDAIKKEVLLPRRLVQEASARIHVLGAGNIGRFIAHALAGIGDPPPITLLSHRRDLVKQWDDEGKKLELITCNTACPRFGVNFRHVTMLGRQADKDEEIIDKLIVTMKATSIVPALLAIKDRILPTSTICFLQNSMGIIDDVNTRVFPNSATRPRYIAGLTSHAVKDQRGRTFTTIHTRLGSTYLSLVPRNLGLPHPRIVPGERQIDQKPLVRRMYYGWTVSSRSLMRSLTRCLILKAIGLKYEHMLQLQFERLAVDATLHSLSVVFDCAPGKLLGNFTVTKLMRGLLQEIIAVAQSVPELRKLDSFRDQFTMKRLESLIVRIASKSNHGLGPMLQDVRKGRQTNINFLNGYIVKRGQELGIPCPVNTTVIQMVKAKQAMSSRREASFIPLKIIRK